MSRMERWGLLPPQNALTYAYNTRIGGSWLVGDGAGVRNSEIQSGSVDPSFSAKEAGSNIYTLGWAWLSGADVQLPRLVRTVRSDRVTRTAIHRRPAHLRVVPGRWPMPGRR